MISFKLGANNGLYLAEPLDTWLTAGQHDFAIPEAAGSSARVFLLKGKYLDIKLQKNPAIKIMRHDKLAYARSLFKQELLILNALADLTTVTPMLMTGYFKADDAVAWPGEIAPLTKTAQLAGSGHGVKGEMVLFEATKTELMLQEYDQRLDEYWLPLIILERRWEDNLYVLADAGYTRGDFYKNLSMRQVLNAALQISESLASAHEKGVIYLDHKLLHYYWNDVRQQVMIVDWNIGRYLEDKITPELKQFDLLQFSARALHHLFTGRQAPGSVAVGPNRPEDIENSPRHFKASYTYDVQKRLNEDEMAFLEKALDGSFASADEMSEALQLLIKKRQ